MTEEPSIDQFFGPKIGATVKEVFYEEGLAIQFLQDAERLERYLDAAEPEPAEEEKIMPLRLRIPWFDCALLLLEGLEYAAEEYDNKVREAAFEYLRLFRRPSKAELERAAQDKAIFHRLWNWLYLQNNVLLDSLLEMVQPQRPAETTPTDVWKYVVEMKPIPAGACEYAMGTPYQQVIFNIPIPKKQEGIAGYLEIPCQISFSWLVKESCMQDYLDGEIRLAADSPGYSLPQRQQFFSILHINLYQKTESSLAKKYLAKCLPCDDEGKFEVYVNQEVIWESLKQRTLYCELTLASRE
jgi:hypothetical protein